MRLGTTIRRLERDERLDPAVAAAQPVADGIAPQRLRDVLHGVQIGHPLHPLMVQVPLGSWISASVLDLFPGAPGARRCAHQLVNLGIATALPAMAAGAADWSRQQQRHQRVGLVHAVTNQTAVLLYAASSLARSRGRHTLGRAFGWAGLGMAGVGGMLGAHIAYNLAGGASHADHVRDRLPAGWHDIGPLTELREGVPVRGVLGDVPLVIVRSGANVRVLADTCSHMGGPLSKGETDGTCITCPWHGSTFRLADGEIVSGPATARQPALEVRVVDGTVQVRRPDDAARIPIPRAEAAAEQPAPGRAGA
ncbi:MAG: Rieske (2Fe-2S) protein [Nocardiopsaceae bacterium]|nr:Rieske (2Fe-2S) protein [Nocardiopsaceae bacterium]